MNRNSIKNTAFAILTVAGCALGQQADVNPLQDIFSFGGDVRVRFDTIDNFMTAGQTGPYETYSRFRTRVWGLAQINDELSTCLKLGNESRNFGNAPTKTRKNKFPDELFVDNLYVEWKNDTYGIKAGRQDIMKEPYSILCDGTLGDGSRSFYFDAVTLTKRFGDKSALDLIGAWNHQRDDYSVGHVWQATNYAERDDEGRAYTKKDDGALIAYATVREFPSVPFDVYWIFKDETEYYAVTGDFPGRNFHTVGARLTPRLLDWLTYEMEAAYQVGELDALDTMKARDISAGLFYSGLIAKAQNTLWKPSLKVAFLYLSGENDNHASTADGNTDTCWNQVYADTSWFSDVPDPMYGGYKWGNLLCPYAVVGVVPGKGHLLSLEGGPLYVADKNGADDDRYRGFFGKCRYGFPLSPVAGVSLSGSVIGSVMSYDDYFGLDESTATAIRCELNARF